MEKVTELKEKVKIKRIVIPIVIVVILCVVAFNAFVVVDAGHTGVVVTMGKVNEGVLQEGIHLKIPFIQSHASAMLTAMMIRITPNMG